MLDTQAVDWSHRGIPWQMKQVEWEEPELVLDWSESGFPIEMDFHRSPYLNRMEQFDWSVDGLPVEIDVCKREMANKEHFSDGQLVVDWSFNGLVLFGFWDDMVVLDWSTRGPCRGGSHHVHESGKTLQITCEHPSKIKALSSWLGNLQPLSILLSLIITRFLTPRGDCRGEVKGVALDKVVGRIQNKI